MTYFSFGYIRIMLSCIWDMMKDFGGTICALWWIWSLMAAAVLGYMRMAERYRCFIKGIVTTIVTTFRNSFISIKSFILRNAIAIAETGFNFFTSSYVGIFMMYALVISGGIWVGVTLGRMELADDAGGGSDLSPLQHQMNNLEHYVSNLNERERHEYFMELIEKEFDLANDSLSNQTEQAECCMHSGEHGHGDAQSHVSKDALPVFSGLPGTYREWKRRVQAWVGGTNVEPNRQGNRILQALKAEAWSATEHIPISGTDPMTMAQSLSGDSGAQLIIAALDEAFMRSESSEIIQCMEDLIFGTRRKTNPTETVHAYIARFRAVIRRSSAAGLTLPETLQAYLLLRRASLGRDDRRSVLASAGGELDPAQIINALKQLYPEEEMFSYDRAFKARRPSRSST